MEIVKTISITPLRTFIGKILPIDKTELFLLTHYQRPNNSINIETYIDDVVAKYPELNLDIGKLIFLLTILDKVFVNNTPTHNGLLESIKIVNYINDNTGLKVDVSYKFD